MTKHLSGVNRVQSMTVLGVVLNASTHVIEVSGRCPCTLYPLRILGSHDLLDETLHVISRSTTLVCLLYPVPTWWGFIQKAANRQRLEHFITRTRRMDLHKTLYNNFIDFRQAFDSVWLQVLWQVLRNYGIPEELAEMLEDMYGKLLSTVRVDGELTEWFRVTVGVRQGCGLSPIYST